MSARSRSIAVYSLVLMTVGAGCAHRAKETPSISRVITDSLIGVIAVSGMEYSQQVVIRSDSAVTVLHASAGDSAALVRLAGVVVRVSGARVSQGMNVSRFRALSVEGSPVIDGTIARDGARIVIVSGTEKVVLGNPPVSFFSMIGARVWVGGPIGSGPNVFGVIVPAKP